MTIIWMFAAIAGVVRYRYFEFWRWLLYAYAIAVTFALLFRGGGTIENPSGDGLITYFVRKITNDGPQVAFMALAVLVVFWGIFLLLLGKSFQNGHAVRKEGRAMSVASTTTKTLEISLILVFIALTGVLSHLDPWEIDEKFLGNKISFTAPEKTVESALAKTVLNMNAELPSRIDKVTVLERTTLKGRTMTYVYTLDIANDRALEAHNFVRPNVISGQCTNNIDAREMMRDYDVAYVYQYYDISRSELFSITVNEQTCLEAGL